jgi:hypothetical protein
MYKRHIRLRSVEDFCVPTTCATRELLLIMSNRKYSSRNTEKSAFSPDGCWRATLITPDAIMVENFSKSHMKLLYCDASNWLNNYQSITPLGGFLGMWSGRRVESGASSLPFLENCT